MTSLFRTHSVSAALGLGLVLAVTASGETQAKEEKGYSWEKELSLIHI